MGTAEDWSGSGIGRPKPGEPYGDAHAGPEGSYSPVTACEAYSRQERDSTVATSIRAGRNLRISSRKASEDNTEADRILKTAEEKAAGIDAEAKARIADADRREHEAAHTVDQARRLLADAAARLARPMPELPATNPRE